MLRQIQVAAAAIALLAAAGCGIKGPLVLPPPAAPPAAAPTPEAITAAPGADPATSKAAPAERKP
jgi:predicted small lipoprotein YifL